MCSRHRGFFYRFRVPFKVLGVILLIALGLSFAYFLSLLGPQSISENELSSMSMSQEDVTAALDQSKALQQQFDEIAGLREPTPEDIALLQQATGLLQGLMEDDPDTARLVRDQLEAVKKQWHEAASVSLMAESREYELKASSRTETSASERLENYQNAIQLQKLINDDYPLSSLKDSRRLARLQRESDMIRAKPLYDKTMSAGERVDAAMQAEDWKAAEEALREAITAQKILNTQYSQLQYANLSRISRLERELVSLESSKYYTSIEEYEKQGREALANNQYREAASAFQKAQRAQEALNREYPESRFASLPRLNDFIAMQQNALGTELADEIQQRLVKLDELLKDRKVWDASAEIQSLSQQIEQFSQTYPRNTMVSEETTQKVSFLAYIQNDLALLQDRIYGQLIPIPGDSGGWHMLRTEVPQALFSSIALANPSRNRGELLPVDSVTWDEAQDFAMKVGWLMGRSTRLPTRDEFLEGLGKLRYVNIDDVSWNQQNSDRRTHEIGTKSALSSGYQDLLGNVAEWLQSEDLPGDAEAYLAGGSAETSIDTLADKPIDIVNRRTRNRMNGFRIAVELVE